MFARYAFNELVSFVAGWAIFLDYTILIAVTALTVPAYLAAFWGPIGRGALEIAVALAVIALVAVDNLTGVSARRIRTRLLITIGDLILQALIIVLGSRSVQRAESDREHPSGDRPELVGPRVRAADRGDRVHGGRGRGEHRGRGDRDP